MPMVATEPVSTTPPAAASKVGNAAGPLPTLRVRLAWLAAAIWVVMALVSATPQWRGWEMKGFDLLAVLDSPGRPVASSITIVGIDEPSFAELQQQWPWPRGMHGQLVEQLKDAGAAVIAFDVVFAEPSDPAQDEYFAGAIDYAANVVLASDIALQETDLFQQVIRVEPHQTFKAAGATSGVASIALDGDLVLRRLPTHEDALWREVLRRHPDAGHRAAAETAVDPATYIRYVGPDHSFPYVSYYQALDPLQFLPPGSLKDRIVLIGRDVKTSPDGATAQADMFATPFTSVTGTLTPGVEVHANAIETMLSGRPIRATSRAALLVVLALALAGAAFGMRRWKPVQSAVTVVFLAMLLGLAAWWSFSRRDRWLPVMAPMAAVGLLYVSQGGVAFLQEQERRRQIKRAFSHYVSPDVVNDLIAHPEKLALGGQRRDLTLMFTDLAGFTSVSEKLKPEEVALLLNEHLTQMTRIVLRHGGTVDKFIGDAIMAFWNAPLDDADHVRHACEAAVEMQVAMRRLRQEFAARGLPAVQMRIGVHTGPAVVGNMGSADRFDYTAIGDNVNLSSRLEGVNKLYGTEILITGAVATALNGRLHVRPVDSVRVKGKAEPVDIYTLLDEPQPDVQRLTVEALTAYKARDWETAADRWHRLLEIEPGDGVARVHLRRLAEFRESPPPPGWDGSVALEKM